MYKLAYPVDVSFHCAVSGNCLYKIMSLMFLFYFYNFFTSFTANFNILRAWYS